jgi:hypothetical protein
MYEKLCAMYEGLVNEILKGIDAIAKSSEKTPPEVVKFLNLHELNSNLIDIFSQEHKAHLIVSSKCNLIQFISI